MNMLEVSDKVQLIFEGKTLTMRELYSLINEVKRRAMSLDSVIEIEMATPANGASVSTITASDTYKRNADE